ncbi:MAG: hypothetical protein MUO76_04320, partial [Anaerolineaceae bacterium]|nr:hypothetical protein [Anaerolineaceae bacterium]
YVGDCHAMIPTGGGIIFSYRDLDSFPVQLWCSFGAIETTVGVINSSILSPASAFKSSVTCPYT